MSTTLRGSNRWALPALAAFYTVLTIAFGDHDSALYVFAVLAWAAAARSLRMRVELSSHEVRHVGFFRTRCFQVATVASVAAADRWGASAPQVHLREGRRLFLHALSSGPARAQEQSATLNQHLGLPRVAQ